MAEDLTGEKHWDFKVIEEAPRSRAGRRRWLCLCRCGDTHIVQADNLKNGLVSHCGCKTGMKNRAVYSRPGKVRIRHGLAGTRTYSSWGHMIQRCHNPKDNSFKSYGAKGIYVYKPWREDFLTFMDYMGPRPLGTHICRIDHTKPYVPGNVMWGTNADESEHKRQQSRREHGSSQVRRKQR